MSAFMPGRVVVVVEETGAARIIGAVVVGPVVDLVVGSEDGRLAGVGTPVVAGIVPPPTSTRTSGRSPLNMLLIEITATDQEEAPDSKPPGSQRRYIALLAVMAGPACNAAQLARASFTDSNPPEPAVGNALAGSAFRF